MSLFKVTGCKRDRKVIIIVDDCNPTTVIQVACENLQLPSPSTVSYKLVIGDDGAELMNARIIEAYSQRSKDPLSLMLLPEGQSWQDAKVCAEIPSEAQNTRELRKIIEYYHGWIEAETSSRQASSRLLELLIKRC